MKRSLFLVVQTFPLSYTPVIPFLVVFCLIKWGFSPRFDPITLGRRKRPRRPSRCFLHSAGAGECSAPTNSLSAKGASKQRSAGFPWDLLHLAQVADTSAGPERGNPSNSCTIVKKPNGNNSSWPRRGLQAPVPARPWSTCLTF